MTDPRLTALAKGLPEAVPFVGPERLERDRGAPFTARLGANEQGFGPSPRVRQAIAEAAGDVWMYPDPEMFELRHALSSHLGVGPAHIAIGGGIDGLLGDLVRLTVAPGDAVVMSAGAYPTFAYHVTGHGGTLHRVPYTGDFEDPTRLVARAAEVGAKLVYLANPDNPMGTAHDAQTILRAIDALPEDALLVLDEAYAEFASPGTVPDLIPEDPRVIRMRTFSKAYGLAGMRVGYAIGPAPLIAAFDRVRDHFGVARIAQTAALTALEDQEWLARIVAATAGARAMIAAAALRHGLVPLASQANFVAIDCGADGAFARRVLEGLATAGVFVRMPGVAPLDRCIRVSCGPEREIDAFARALPRALAAARA